MSRRYVRDNRGRFATTGATARGGRLKTAAGNRRATQTITAAKAGGRIAKPAGLQPGSIKPKAAAKTPLQRSGKRVSVPLLTTNAERGKRGVVSMSPIAKASRRVDVVERRAEKTKRLMERAKPSEMRARRRNSTLPTYSPKGEFDQAAASLNQKKAARTEALIKKNPIVQVSIKPKVAAPKRKPMTRPGFEQSDFLRRSGRAATIRNPEIRAKAQGLYRNAAYSGATAKELERAFRKTSKFSTVTRPKKPKRALRAGEREHRDMLKLAPRLFR